MVGIQKKMKMILPLFLVSVGICAAYSSPVSAAPQYNFNCSSCHGMPPLDAVTRDPATGGIPGNHQTHLPATAVAANCNKCHNDSTAYTTRHMDGQIGFSADINTSGSGQYIVSGLPATFKNQTSVPALGSCSSVNCHSDGKSHFRSTPTWGSSSAATNCLTCHDAAPATGTHPSATNKHGIYYGTDTASCGKCHSDHTAEIQKFAHATSAGRAIDVHFTAAPNTGGSFSGTQCSNIYCHSDGTKATGYTGKSPSPTWGGTALTCTGCHGGGAGSPAFMSLSTGRHAKHVYGQYSYSCTTCHTATVDAANAVSDRSKHVNGQIDVVFNGIAKTGGAGAVYTITGHTPGQTGTTSDSCQNVYCHSNAQTGGQAGTQLLFRNLTGAKRFNQTTTVSLGCNGCHSTGSTTTGQWTLSGKHLAHVSATVNPSIGKALACNDCHANGGTNFNRANHANGYINYSSPLAGKQSTLNLASGNCSATYCHSNGKGVNKSMATDNWFSSTNLDCKGCHGSEGTPAFTSQFGEPNYAADNSHQKHVSAAADCYTCHRTTTTSAGALSATTTHVNRNIDVNIPKLAGFNNLSGVYNKTTKSCSATYCHSNGSPVWGNAATGACGSCHDASAAIAGAGKPTISTNGHDSHLTLGYGPGAYLGTALTTCQLCHTSYVNGASHVNGVASYNAASGSACYNCHAGTVPSWTGAAHSVSCESCHGSTPATLPNGVAAPSKAANFAAAGHGKYAASNACVSCHDQNSAHISGTLGDATRLLGTLGTGNTNCSYCHSDPAKVTTAKFQNMSTHFLTYGGPQAMGCNMCHDPHGTGNLSMIKSKIKFSNLSATITYNDRSNGWVDLVTSRGLCQVCHTATRYYKNGVAETAHYTSNCFSCHGHNAAGGAFKPAGNCDTCHGYPPVPRKTLTAFTFGTMGNYTNARYEDYSGGGGAHVVETHVPKSVKASDGWTPCLNCHNGGAAAHTKVTPVREHVSNVTVSLKQSYKKLNVGIFNTYTGAKLENPPAANTTGSCYNISCHFRPSPRWSSER